MKLIEYWSIGYHLDLKELIVKFKTEQNAKCYL